MARIEPQLSRRLRGLSLVCVFLGALFPLLALAGWSLNFPTLTSIVPGWAVMKFNTAVALLACALAMAIRNRSSPGSRLDRMGDAVVFVGIAIGLLTLFQYAFKLDFRIDRLLYNDSAVPPHGFPGRMSIATAFAVAMLSIGIFSLDRTTRLSQICVLAALMTATLGMLGYAFGIRSLYRTYAFSSMALNTAVTIALLACGHLASRPRRCLHHLLITRSQGGMLARRLLPATVLVPLLAGWIIQYGESHGAYDAHFSLAIMALVTIFILATLVWRNATLLDQSERQRHRLEVDRDTLLVREQAARNRVEAALVARDQFLGIVSHELRTPLTPMLLATAALEQRQNLPADVLEDLQMIHEQIDIETRLIEDLLDMTRLNQGKMILKRQSVDLQEIVRSLMTKFDKPLAESNLKIHFKLAAEPLYVSGDLKRLTQVVSHLIANAIKFSLPGREVTVRTTREPDQSVCLEVADSGTGIDAKTMATIFDPFVQGDATLRRQYSGLGVGLTIARHLVDLHGGKIHARSEGVNKGAVFSMSLPGVAAPVATVPEKPAPTHLRSILLVDDNLQIVQALQKILEMRGHRVVLATSAKEGIAAVVGGGVDLVISDIGLPDMSGWEMMRQLRDRHPLPAIAVSGFTADEDRHKSLESGFRVHLDKPVDLNLLLAAIEMLEPAKKPVTSSR